MVSIILTLSSRATIAAGTRPPRVMQTMASNGPASCSRQASARESRWNWSHDTGKIFSGRGDCSGCGFGIALPHAGTGGRTSGVFNAAGMSARRPQLRSHLDEHRFDLGLYRGELSRVTRAHHDIGVRPVLLVDERVAADDRFRMRLGDDTEFGADIAFLGIGAD